MQLWQASGSDVQPGPVADDRHATEVQAMPDEQLWLPVQRTSHAQDGPQVTSRHDCGPVHSTSHLPVPHVTPRHEPIPVHSTMHDVEPVHVTPFRHALSVSHFTSHDHPAGHATLPLQFAPPAQSITHECVDVLQLVHCEGQPLPVSPGRPSIGLIEASMSWVPLITQNPSEHTRPSLQSDCFVHAKSPLFFVIEQLVASANTAVTWSARRTSHFMGLLRR
jgi:hypothetical protein